MRRLDAYRKRSARFWWRAPGGPGRERAPAGGCPGAASRNDATSGGGVLLPAGNGTLDGDAAAAAKYGTSTPQAGLTLYRVSAVLTEAPAECFSWLGRTSGAGCRSRSA